MKGVVFKQTTPHNNTKSSLICLDNQESKKKKKKKTMIGEKKMYTRNSDQHPLVCIFIPPRASPIQYTRILRIALNRSVGRKAMTHLTVNSKCMCEA